jgi:hypothetical protein
LTGCTPHKKQLPYTNTSVGIGFKKIRGKKNKLSTKKAVALLWFILE